MPKCFLTIDPENPDPANGPFYVVHYKSTSPAERAAQARRAQRMQEYMDEINSNPVTKYMYERENDQRHVARRLAKQRGWDSMSWDELLRYVKSNWNNSSEPTLIGSNVTEEGFTKRMTFRQQLHGARRAHHGAVERAAEDGNYKSRKFTHAFIESVKDARNAKGLTQQELANAINRPSNEISQLERGALPYDGELKSLLHNALDL
jgi:hypothetical protein